jgi:glutathione S-transferase
MVISSSGNLWRLSHIWIARCPNHLCSAARPRIRAAFGERVNYRPGYQIAGPIFFKRQESAEEIRAAIEPLHTELKLEASLSHSPWLDGDGLSVGDIVAYPLIETVLRAAGKDAARSFDLRLLPIGDTYPAIAAWRERIQALPGYERTYLPHWRAAR